MAQPQKFYMSLDVTEFKPVTKKAEGGEDAKFLWVRGYASHGDTDTYGDRISDQALLQMAEMLPGVPLLHNHDADQQIGKVDRAWKVENEPAVMVEAWVPMSEGKIIEKIQDGRLDSFSIHMIADEWNIKSTASEYVVTIMHWERAIELSLTSVPVQEKAKVIEHWVKSFKESLKSEMEKRLDTMADELKSLRKSIETHQDPPPVTDPVSQGGEEEMKIEDILKAIGDAAEKDERFKTVLEPLRCALSGENFPESHNLKSLVADAPLADEFGNAVATADPAGEMSKTIEVSEFDADGLPNDPEALKALLKAEREKSAPAPVSEPPASKQVTEPSVPEDKTKSVKADPFEVCIALKQ